MKRDTTLDTLLLMDGEKLFINEDGYWVKFIVRAVPVTESKPHGLDYSLTLHDPNGERLMGFDNAHPIKQKAKTKANDHKHRLDTVKPYIYRNAGTLMEDFWKEVDKLLEEILP